MKAGKRKKDKDAWVDDGRTIADMSLVTRENLLLPRRFPDREPENASEDNPDSAPSFVEEDGIISDPGEHTEKPWEKAQNELTPKESRTYLFSALAAGLLLVLIFIAAGGLLILLLLHLWS